MGNKTGECLAQKAGSPFHIYSESEFFIEYALQLRAFSSNGNFQLLIFDRKHIEDLKANLSNVEMWKHRKCQNSLVRDGCFLSPIFALPCFRIFHIPFII